MCIKSVPYLQHGAFKMLWCWGCKLNSSQIAPLESAVPALIDYVAKFPPNIMQISEPLQKIGANKVP